jgi:hypothetical protein
MTPVSSTPPGSAPHLDPAAARDAVARCRLEADRAFARLVAHPDAPALFQSGKAATPDSRGFRKVHKDRLRGWLTDQLGGVTDRRGVPVPHPTAGGEIERRLVNWPAWSVGTEPLAALADLQVAEKLADKLDHGLGLTTGEYAAYARLRRAGRVPPCIAPRPGCTLVRVGLADLPAVALAAVLDKDPPPSALAAAVRSGNPPGGWIRTRLAADPTLPPLTAVQAAGLLVLIGAGTGIPALGVLSGWLYNLSVTKAGVQGLVAAVHQACPELDRHLADRSLDQLAARFKVDPADLASWCGYHGPPYTGSFLNAFVGSGAADRCGVGLPSQVEAFGRDARAGRFIPTNTPAGPSALAQVIERYAAVLAEVVTLPSGRTLDRLPWVAARASFLTAAGAAVDAAASALKDAGLTVVVVLPDELLVEVPNGDASSAAIGGAVAGACGAVLGLPPVNPVCEQVVLW